MLLRFLSMLFLKISKTCQLLNFKLLNKNNYILPNTQSLLQSYWGFRTPWSVDMLTSLQEATLESGYFRRERQYQPSCVGHLNKRLSLSFSRFSSPTRRELVCRSQSSNTKWEEGNKAQTSGGILDIFLPNNPFYSLMINGRKWAMNSMVPWDLATEAVHYVTLTLALGRRELAELLGAISLVKRLIFHLGLG